MSTAESDSLIGLPGEIVPAGGVIDLDDGTGSTMQTTGCPCIPLVYSTPWK